MLLNAYRNLFLGHRAQSPFFKCPNSFCSLRDDLPFRYWATFDGLRVGGQETSTWTRAALTCPFNTLLSRLMQSSRIKSRKLAKAFRLKAKVLDLANGNK